MASRREAARPLPHCKPNLHGWEIRDLAVGIALAVVLRVSVAIQPGISLSLCLIDVPLEEGENKGRNKGRREIALGTRRTHICGRKPIRHLAARRLNNLQMVPVIPACLQSHSETARRVG